MDFRVRREVEETIRHEPIEHHTLNQMFDRPGDCIDLGHDWHQDNDERVCVKCGKLEFVRIPCPVCSELTQRLYEVFSRWDVIFVGCYHCYVEWGDKAAKAIEHYDAYLKRQAKRKKAAA